MPFGVRRTQEPIPANTDFYACPLCSFSTLDKHAMIDHLVSDHNLQRRDARQLVEQTA